MRLDAHCTRRPPLLGHFCQNRGELGEITSFAHSKKSLENTSTVPVYFLFFAVLEPRRKVSWEERRASAIQGRREDFGRVSTSSSEESRRGSYQSRRRATNQELSQPPGTLFLSRPPRGPLVPPYVVKEDPMNESCLQVMKLVVRPRGGAARIFTGATYLQRSRNRCHLTQLEKNVFFLDKTLKTHELKKRRGLKAIPFMNDFSWLFRKVLHLLSPFCIIMD